MKKIVAIILVLVLSLTGCSKSGTTAADNGTTKISFKEAVSVDMIKKLSGKEVTINGFIATSSPADGSFIFLMNLPYQNCPFCVPNTSQLANTLEVYPKAGSKFEYTGQAVSVTGRMEIAPDDKPFTDDFGYEFGYKLVDAEYHIMTEKDMDSKLQSYQTIASSGLIDEIYKMFDYVYLVTHWTEYYQPSFTDIDGSVVNGFWFNPADVAAYIEANLSYMTDTYFVDVHDKIAKVCVAEPKTAETLQKLVENSAMLSNEAVTAANNAEWTTETKYWEVLECEETKYTLNNYDVFDMEYQALWSIFCDFVNGYEL